MVHIRAFAKRPAVVRACASGLDDIDLLKEVRADVADEESAIAVDGEPEWIAQAVHPDGAACISAAGKRIVRRDRAVLVDAQNLAADVRQVERSLSTPPSPTEMYSLPSGPKARLTAVVKAEWVSEKMSSMRTSSSFARRFPTIVRRTRRFCLVLPAV